MADRLQKQRECILLIFQLYSSVFVDIFWVLLFFISSQTIDGKYGCEFPLTIIHFSSFSKKT